MKNQTIKIQLLRRDAVLPTYSHPGEDAAFDVHCVHGLCLMPGDILTTPLGFAAQLPKGFYGQLFGKSGYAREGLAILGGVIDGGYRGEWHAQLYNAGPEPLTFKSGSAVAQCVVLPIPNCEIKNTTRLARSQRGKGAFGSTARANQPKEYAPS